MADDYKSDDQQSIDSAINKLEERKNGKPYRQILINLKFFKKITSNFSTN